MLYAGLCLLLCPVRLTVNTQHSHRPGASPSWHLTSGHHDSTCTHPPTSCKCASAARFRSCRSPTTCRHIPSISATPVPAHPPTSCGCVASHHPAQSSQVLPLCLAGVSPPISATPVPAPNPPPAGVSSPISPLSPPRLSRWLWLGAALSLSTSSPLNMHLPTQPPTSCGCVLSHQTAESSQALPLALAGCRPQPLHLKLVKVPHCCRLFVLYIKRLHLVLAAVHAKHGRDVLQGSMAAIMGQQGFGRGMGTMGGLQQQQPAARPVVICLMSSCAFGLWSHTAGAASSSTSNVSISSWLLYMLNTAETSCRRAWR